MSDDALGAEYVYWFRVGRNENGLKGAERETYIMVVGEWERRKKFKESPLKIVVWCCDDADYLKKGWKERMWSETYREPEIKDIKAAREFAHGTIKQFNRFLRPGERKRRVVRTELVIDDAAPKERHIKHDWRKASLVTICKGGRVYDKYKCERCGAMGKRHGLSEQIRPDKANQEFCKA